MKFEEIIFNNIIYRMTPEALKVIESGNMVGTVFTTYAELNKIKCENKNLKSQCECLKKRN